MSPRLRPRGGWSAATLGRLVRLVRLGEARIGVTLALDPVCPGAAALMGRIAVWESWALKAALRRKAKSAHEYRGVAKSLRLRPTLPSGRAELRMTGFVQALVDVDVPRLGAVSRSLGQELCAGFTAAPVILPAAGLVALELGLTRLSTPSGD